MSPGRANLRSLRQPKPPVYWDNLSKTWLTEGALWELQRRTGHLQAEGRRKAQASQRPCQPADIFLQNCALVCLEEVEGLSRGGGPDLSDLRGYRPPSIDSAHGSMSPTRPGPSRNKRRPQSLISDGDNSASDTPTATTTTPYSLNFQQHLIDHKIYPAGHGYRETQNLNKPDNMEDIKDRMTGHRPSLTPSRFNDTDYARFMGEYFEATTEQDVRAGVLPFLQGNTNTSNYAGRDVLFNNLAPLTDGTLSLAKPDMYHGTRPDKLSREVRQDIGELIIPSNNDSFPIAPNFFLEVKGEDGKASVAKRQACYNGALGARGMQALRSYQPTNKSPHTVEPVYDNNAHTITSTYAHGQVKLWTSHLAEPITPGGRPENFMTPLGSYEITHGIEQFREGAAAFRNAQDWARESRDGAIVQANEQLLKARCEAQEIPGAPRLETGLPMSKIEEYSEAEAEDDI
ncbi:hypothetical protein BJX99DRAFT_123468 [Aspergillus californicus]